MRHHVSAGVQHAHRASLVSSYPAARSVAGQLSDDDVLLCPFDVSDEAEQKKALERVLQHFGRLDILVNNAGRIYFSEFAKDTPADDLSVFRVNTFANVNLARLAIRHWTQSGRHGQIVVTTSLAAYIHSPFMHIYGASKRALHVSRSPLAVGSLLFRTEPPKVDLLQV